VTSATEREKEEKREIVYNDCLEVLSLQERNGNSSVIEYTISVISDGILMAKMTKNSKEN
jgi:hypothetical protein